MRPFSPIRAILGAGFLLGAYLHADVETQLINVRDVPRHAEQNALQGRPEEAVAELKELLQRAPADADAWLTLGLIYRDQGKSAESKACFGKVRTLMPQEAEALLKEAGAQHQAQKAQVHEAQVEQGELGYPLASAPVKDPEPAIKSTKWSRKWDKPKAPPKPKAKASKTALKLPDVSEGPKIKSHP